VAGASPRFNAAKFRTGIRGAMEMGTPSGSAERITFHFAPTTTTTATHDGAGVPFDPSEHQTVTPAPAVTATCVVEFFDAGGEAFTPFGVTRPARVVVSLFEDEYAVVRTASHVTIRGDLYGFSHEPPAFGLFDVTFHQLVYRTETET
jgi:hypothetical protein